MQDPFLFALLLCCLAGTATILGGVVSFCIKKENLAALAVGLGVSAGVMIYVSFMELLPQSARIMSAVSDSITGARLSTVLFFGGILIAWGIDCFLPSHHVSQQMLEPSDKLKRLGLFTALVLAVHNLPEGLATFMAALQSPALGVSVTAAVALHNIPEGVAVALPVFHATGSRKKALLYSALSGLAEPVGAVVGFVILRHFLQEETLGVLFALVAGIMVYVALDELLPTAHEYGEGHHVIWGVIAGMAVMALSLLWV